MMAAGNPNWWSIEQHQQQSPHDLLPSANLHASATTPSSSSPLATVAGTAQHHQQNNNGSSLLSLLLHNQHQYLHVGLGSSSSPSSLSSCSSSSSSSSSSSTTSSSSSSSLPFSPLLSDHQSGTGPPPDITQSWNKLLSAGLPSEEDERTPTGYIGSHNFQATGGRQFDQNTTSSWGLFGGVNHHAMISSPSTRLMVNLQDDHHYHHHLQQQQQPQNLMVKQEDLFPPQTNNSLLYGLDNNHQRLFYHQQQQSALSNLHNHHQFPPHNLSTIQAAAVSSPRSLSGSDNSNSNNNNNSLLDFSTSSVKGKSDKNTRVDHSSECSSAATASTGGVAKKARAQSSSTPPLKVRKEKLGDRITALHQIVSPFGKTDTASVLLEAIGYIRFLQSQIEVLSSPYIGTNTAAKHQHPAAHGDRNCLFPDHPGQLLNDSCLKRRAANHQDVYSYKDTGHSSPQPPKDLRSRGLCLVPVSCTQLVGGETGGDNYWGPSLGGGF